MLADVFDLALGLGLFGVAVGALVVRRRQTAVVLFLVFGVLLATLWARLAAPDIALAEAALGAGVTGALLVDALADRRASPPAGASSRLGWWVGGLVIGVALLTVFLIAVRALPDPDGDLADRVAGDLAETGVDHDITAVLLNFRSYDTLLEVAVLAVAAFAALSLMGYPEPRWSDPWPAGPPPALAVLVRILAPLAMLTAVWLLVAGTSRPGGAFQAGALLAAVLILVHLGEPAADFPHGRVLGTLLFAGLLVFIAVAVATALVGAGWLVLDESWAGPVIVAIESVLALSIGFGLAALFVADRTALADRTGLARWGERR